MPDGTGQHPDRSVVQGIGFPAAPKSALLPIVIVVSWEFLNLAGIHRVLIERIHCFHFGCESDSDTR